MGLLGMSLPFTKSFMAMVPGFEPGTYDARGNYIPTSAQRTAFQAARIPWAEQVVYGYYTLAFLLGILVLAVGVNVLWILRVRHRVKIPGYASLAAVFRLATYPRLQPNRLIDMMWTLGPIGPNVLLATGLLFVSCLTWINEYYYYPPYYGSAPLYLRSEWIAMATLPFVYVLGSKRNMISVLTGVSHEKLQVLHQGAAFNFIYMSLVHTIAACIRAEREYGMRLMTEYNVVYVSGFVALAPMLLLFLLALPPVRKYSYEAFYYIHIVMALFFLGALFWHGYQLLDSDAYCIATIILFLTGVAWRLGWMLLNNPTWHTATIVVVSSDTFKMTVPTSMTWRAGQHVFLRFPAVRPLESHPFTIANAPSKGASGDAMTFLVRVKTGFTRSLLDHIDSNSSTGDNFRVLVDGPYGHAADELRSFDHVLVCAGGSGISWALAAVQSLAGSSAAVRLIWAVRDQDALKWFEDELAALENVTVERYITGGISPGEAEPEEKSPTSASGSSSGSAAGKLMYGRPDLPRLISETVVSANGSIAIAACGPSGLLADAANAVARAQTDILCGRLLHVDEVYLASEAYGW